DYYCQSADGNFDPLF
nr:immunoglobulin light chain junction region [Macaca mulatta]MOW31008.1 immunoglobulin light chain junction region [Macaca mulatta]MOW31010.1 immunoglobulin light chain junction region [Macaca mulatta]MOW31016.1 immunoglobulin light chain junction region [Macaca mulatta]MOW31033.1 immunoglobulin light chain junction region [Macaca mulatta]